MHKNKMHSAIGEIKVFAATANPHLADAIVKNLGIEMGKSNVSKFEDGECSIQVNETVRGSDVFIVQSTSPPVNDNLMELLIMIDAMRRSSAGRITAVVPYFGYARQDRRARSHDPISAKLVADLITIAGVDRVLSMDLHAPQIQGFFNIPFDHLSGVHTFVNYYKDKGLSNAIVVSPDFGSVARCSTFAKELGISLAIVDKRRDENNVPYVANFIGDVKGKKAILLDDVFSSGSSLKNAAEEVIKMGADSVSACVTHPVLSDGALENMENSPLDEIVVLNTIEVPEDKRHPKLVLLSVAKLFSEAIEGIHQSRSIGQLSRKSYGVIINSEKP
jgi:ribose-phosphate pyrophosphokinase